MVQPEDLQVFVETLGSAALIEIMEGKPNVERSAELVDHFKPDIVV